MYISYVPGRVRIRLDDHALVNRIAQMVQSMPGVIETTTNQQTGSLLVLFEEHLLDRKTLNSLMEKYLPGAGKTTCKSRKASTTMSVVKMGMLAGLGVGLVSALLDEEGPHIAMGAFFLGLLSYHLYAYRKRLFI